MKRWVSSSSRWLLLFAAMSFPIPASAQQRAVPLGTYDVPYGYYEYRPEGYDSGTDEWPLVVFLHGAGEVGNGTDQLSRVLAAGVPQYIANNVSYPFIALSPQSPMGWWDVEDLDALIEFAKGFYRVDPRRIYLTGISMGGGGVWEYAKAHPEKLAAILPICGVDSTPAGSRLASLPTWAFHAWGDGFVSAQASIAWANAISGALAGGPPTDVMASYPVPFANPPGPGHTSDLDRTASFDAATGSWTWNDGVPQPTGGQTLLTLYKSDSHFIWDTTYANPVVWDWLLAQSLPGGDPEAELIVPAGAGTAAGSAYFPLQDAFDAQPILSAGQPEGGSGGSDAPFYASRVGYIDFGPDWQNVRITSSWTRYRAWSLGNQTPFAELWWDDDNDAVNDGASEPRINFNTAQGLDTGSSEPWLRDRDLGSNPVLPQGRFLLCRAPADMTNRAKEYAILGFRGPDEPPPSGQLIVPAAAGAADGIPYFPMQEAFDAQPTLSAGQPTGGSGGSDAPFYADRVGYIDFGPEWYKVRITSTWTRYRAWSLDDQTPYEELWWDDDIDTVNDSGLSETQVNFNTAQGLDSGLAEPWLRDRDLASDPVVPRARYLLCRTPDGMTNRAKEYAMIGFIDPDATP